MEFFGRLFANQRFFVGTSLTIYYRLIMIQSEGSIWAMIKAMKDSVQVPKCM